MVRNLSSVRTPKPVPPLGQRALSLSANAGPAISKCAHGNIADKFLQDQCRCDRAAMGAADVFHVGDAAFDQLFVLL